MQAQPTLEMDHASTASVAAASTAPPPTAPKPDGPASRPKRAKPTTPRSSTGSSSAPRPPKPASERKSKATFTTVRSYPEPAAMSQLHSHVQAEEENLQRSQRKSKVDAKNKLDRVGTPIASIPGPPSTSFIPPPPPPAGPSVLRNPLRRPPVANPPFDLNTVRTEAPRHPPPRQEPRMFGLEECPTFYPTMQEFTDPMEYISSIGHLGRPYGIAKIVPPEGWRMPFTLATENFRFKTRLQRINSLEAASRAKVNFLEQLSMFHKQQGNANATIPIIERKTVDLWRLRKEVNKVGGVLTLNRTDGWGSVTETMGFGRHCTHHIKQAYMEVVHPFDEWSIRAKASLSQSPMRPHSNASGTRPPVFKDEPGSPTKKSRMSGMRSGPRPSVDSLLPPLKIKLNTGMSKSSSMPNSLNTRAQASGNVTISVKPEIQINGEAAPETPVVKVRVPGFSSAGGDDSDLSSEASSADPPTPPPLPKYVKGDVCEICRHGHSASKILLCDGCDRGFHIYCLDPPLQAVPTNEEWFCSACLFSQGDDFGFEEGDEHSIPSFQARDAAFAFDWWNRHRPGPSTSTLNPESIHRTFGKVAVTESDVEREFWRLTESSTETVEIEYGADVHSTTHGSAAPTKEEYPLNPYSDDPWNLNNMPIVKESLLRYIKSDISGMTVPWIYLGMLFSAFCWHNEDHYTYSVNYMHWGETKTWYGVPGDDADKFEEAIKSEAPELFEQQPALLYQLVTMMNPGRLQELGVKVVGCDQRPNEFVITWPKAYHCGFNHGINFNEAVNFALPDWLPQGKDCILRYKQHAKAPVFSHNELLITITLFSDTIKTALWLKDSLAEMVQEETARRDRLRSEIPLLAEVLVEEDCPEEQYQCCICKGFCYLSQVTCTCTKLVACVDHADQLCQCAKSKRTLRKRYSENQLEEILAAVEARAAQPSNWRTKFDNLLEAPRPPLKTMRTLLADGERISYPIPEVEDLRALIDRANAWVDKVSALGQRKSTGRRRKGRLTEMEEPDRSPHALRALLKEVERLAFDSPEILQLRQVLHDIESFKQQAELILSTPDQDLHLDQCQTALILGKSLNIDMAEIDALSTVVNRLQWYKKLDEEVDDRTLTLANVKDLIDEAGRYKIPYEHDTYVELRNRLAKGQEWTTSVQRLFVQPRITIEEISALLENLELVPTDIDTVRQLESMKKTAQTWQTTALGILAGSGTVVAVQRLLKQIKSASPPTSRIYIAEIASLTTEMEFHAKWATELSALLGCTVAKMPQTLGLHLELVANGLDPDDDLPKDDWATCFCRDTPKEVMVTCEECKGAYHPKCVKVAPKQADKPFVCEMCSDQYDTDRPSVNALATFIDSRKWDFVIPPAEVLTIEAILHAFVRYAKLVLDLADPKDMVERCQDHHLIAHHLRKMYNIPLLFDARHTDTNTVIVFETWLKRRWREARDYATSKPKSVAAPVPPHTSRRNGDQKYTRSRKPKFVLKESREGEFSCICSTPPIDALLVVYCLRCQQGYHASCVHCSLDQVADVGKWKCPCCAVKSGQHFQRNVELRIQMTADLGTEVYVDYRATLKYFAEQPIKMILPPTPTSALDMIVLECTEFIEPYIPEDQERDEAGQPKKKSRLESSLAPGEINAESTNGGSPLPQSQVGPSATAIPASSPVVSHASPSMPAAVPIGQSNGHGGGASAPQAQSNGLKRNGDHMPRPYDRVRPAPDLGRNTVPAPVTASTPPAASGILSSTSPYSSPFMPRPTPAQTYMPSPRPNYSPFSGPSPWAGVSAGSSPNSNPHANPPKVATPAMTPVTRPMGTAQTPPDAMSIAAATNMARLTMQRRQELEDFEQQDRERAAEREKKRSEMRSHAERIVDTMRKEGINGSSS